MATLQNGWSVSIEAVTPEAAEAWLKMNIGNRSPRGSVVARYSATMASGNWRLSPDGLIFASDGRLIQGQHRLKAVVQSGCSVDMIVWRGVAPDVYKVLDRGVMRTASDASGMPRRVIEVATIAARASGVPAPQMHDALVTEYSEVLRESHEVLMNYCGANAKIFSTAPVRAAAAIRMLAGFDKEYVGSVYRSMVLGHIAELPRVAQEFVGQAHRGMIKSGGGAGQADTFARAWTVFDPSKSDLARLKVNGADSAFSDVKAIMQAAMGKP